jgi:hypothetical protein
MRGVCLEVPDAERLAEKAGSVAACFGRLADGAVREAAFAADAWRSLARRLSGFRREAEILRVRAQRAAGGFVAAAGLMLLAAGERWGLGGAVRAYVADVYRRAGAGRDGSVRELVWHACAEWVDVVDVLAEAVPEMGALLGRLGREAHSAALAALGEPFGGAAAAALGRVEAELDWKRALGSLEAALKELKEERLARVDRPEGLKEALRVGLEVLPREVRALADGVLAELDGAGWMCCLGRPWDMLPSGFRAGLETAFRCLSISGQGPEG